MDYDKMMFLLDDIEVCAGIVKNLIHQSDEGEIYDKYGDTVEPLYEGDDNTIEAHIKFYVDRIQKFTEALTTYGR